MVFQRGPKALRLQPGEQLALVAQVFVRTSGACTVPGKCTVGTAVMAKVWDSDRASGENQRATTTACLSATPERLLMLRLQPQGLGAYRR